MARFEQKHIYPFIKGKVDLCLRYIDDIFFIWKGAQEELKNFFNKINKKHPSIKFDQKYSKSKIEFLDVLVYKDEQQRLQTTNSIIYEEHRQTILSSCKMRPPSVTQKKYSVQSNIACQKNLFNKAIYKKKL